MKVPFSWLKEFVDVDISAQELEKRLFGCGFEVDQLIDLSAGISRVVVGEILSMEPLEGSDHLHVCHVNCGPAYGTDLVIVCGASNMKPGDRVPAALDGATLPGGVKIAARKMHGAMSNGMLCSGNELGLNDDLYPGADVYGLLILKPDDPIGEDICRVTGLNDYVFDIEVTANRPDCQSVLGIAREVAALLGKPLKMPETGYTCPSAPDSSVHVTVEAPDLCPRYLAHFVRNIRPSESPQWLKRHLALTGLRSINNVVDITNHTLIEIGQPMHAFDLSKVKGRSIIVRRAKPGEKIITLDEKEFALNENNLVICDTEKPVCIAGIMGGRNSGIADDTTELLFECATFRRDSIRKTSRALGQNSDSSARYEKGVDQYSTELGMRRALHLIQQLDCGDITSTEFDISAGESRERRVLTVTPAQINRLLGITVPDSEVRTILERLDFGVEIRGRDWLVSIPRYREDVESYPDLSEEVIREYGYDKLVPTFLPTAKVTSGGLSTEQHQRLKLKRTMAGQGFFEINTLAFYSPADLDRLHIPSDSPLRQTIRIRNPISENLSVMRTTLLPSMLNTIVDNLKKGNSEGRLFEISNVYIPHSLPLTEFPDEHLSFAIGCYGPDEDFFTMKGALEAVAKVSGLTFVYERGKESWLHPGMTADVLCGGVKVGTFGKLANEITAELKIAKDEKVQQNIYLAELNYAALAKLFPADCRYVPIPAFQPVRRDLALVCSESDTCGAIEEIIRRASPLVSAVSLFDLYRGKSIGEGKKSMAFTVQLSDPEKEVSDEAADRAVKKILGNLSVKMKITLRQE